MEFHSLCLDAPIRDSISSSFIDIFANMYKWVKQSWILIFKFLSHQNIICILFSFTRHGCEPVGHFYRTRVRFYSFMERFWGLQPEHPLSELVFCWCLRVGTCWVMTGKILRHGGTQEPINLLFSGKSSKCMRKAIKYSVLYQHHCCHGRKTGPSALSVTGTPCTRLRPHCPNFVIWNNFSQT